LKFGAFTACSNVTGIRTPVHQMASLMHRYGGYCFVDYAACAPYDSIDMHPADPMEKLDAIYFSPHKFLGGPGSSGVLIFDSQLYRNRVPDQPGGGTVEWTNPWGEHRYVADIEVREDGGTPGFSNRSAPPWPSDSRSRWESMPYTSAKPNGPPGFSAVCAALPGCICWPIL
jgi:selenocysteine lyase/cysteine desulfurase